MKVSGGDYCSSVRSGTNTVVVDVVRGTAGASTAGTVGAVPMSSSVSYNSTTTAATSSAVRSAYNLAASKISSTNYATSSVGGTVKVSNSAGVLTISTS